MAGISTARREIFDSEAGKNLLKEWGVPESYKGIGFCILGYKAESDKQAVPRRDGRIIYQ